MSVSELDIYNYAFIQATLHGDFEMLERCLACGADPNVTDQDGNAPLHLVARARHRHVGRLFRFLLDKGACPAVSNMANETCGHVAAAVGALDLLTALQDRNARLDLLDGRKRSLLHAGIAHPEVVAFLLKAGLPKNAQDVEGATPLMLAVGLGQLSSMRLLLEAGADSSLLDKEGKNAVALAWLKGDQAAIDLLYEFAKGA